MKASRLFAILALSAAALSASSCTGVVSGITGQSPAATPVQREGGKPVQIATTDLLQAEAGPPETIHGLYDVGFVAGAVGRIADTGK